MIMETLCAPEPVADQAAFVTTHWSAVAAAGRSALPEARAALAELFQVYWYPLYAFARSRGQQTSDAEDSVQGFLERVLEKNYFELADRRRGRFRWFLLTAFKCYLAHERDRATAQKRGGGRTLVSFEVATAEGWLQAETPSGNTPDRNFDRQWAVSLLAAVRERLRHEYEARDRGRYFDVLSQHLPGVGAPGDSRVPSVDLAMDLAASPGALKVELHRLKRRFGELVRAEISRTVASADEVDDELRYLVEVLSA